VMACNWSAAEAQQKKVAASGKCVLEEPRK
jgi:hypothetical protein